MNHTRIDWAQYSWNPVTGCTHGCDYCYARRIAERFGGPDGFKPTFHEDRLSELDKIKKPSRIFVCSMADLFGYWVPDDWIIHVLLACHDHPQHQYLFLTKNPKCYERLFIYQSLFGLHANWWLGATFDTANDTISSRVHLLTLHEEGWHTWVSAEPLLEDITPYWAHWEDTTDWLVIGAMTGPGSKKRQPDFKWIESLTDGAIVHGVPVFHKKSLASFYWPFPRLQQYPKAMTQEATP